MADQLSRAHAIEDAGIERASAGSIATEIDAMIRENVATKGDLVVLQMQIELRLIKWMIGIAIAAVVAIVGALSGVIWAATQMILHVRP